jgi:hypothetical protein
MGYIRLGRSGTISLEFDCESWDYSIGFQPKIKHMNGGTSYGYDLGARVRKVTLSNIVFTTKTAIDEFVTDIQTLQAAGAFDLNIVLSSAPTYYDFAGAGGASEKRSLKVLVSGNFSVSKVAPGNDTTYAIDSLNLEEAGTWHNTLLT